MLMQHKEADMSKTSKAITTAAAQAGDIITRFQRVEEAARAARVETETRAVMRALFTADGAHYVRLDRGSTIIEIQDGAVAVSVRDAGE